MKKSLLKFVILVLAAVVMYSCEKDIDDDTVTQPSSTDDGEVALSDDNARHCISKPAIIAKVGLVYVLSVTEDGDEVYVPHRTLKVRNLKNTVMQEWLLDYLHTTVFDPWFSLPGDEDGSKYGLFYKWYNCFANLPNDEFDYLVFDKDGNSEKGFHIPSLFDITQYNSLFNDKVEAANKLNLQMNVNSTVGRLILQSNQDVDISFDHHFDLPMWYYVPSELLAHPECGAAVIWPRKGNDYKDITLVYTNNPDVVQRVRLVRDLEKW